MQSFELCAWHTFYFDIVKNNFSQTLLLTKVEIVNKLIKPPMLSQNHLYSQEPVHIRCIHGQSQASKLFPLKVLHTHVKALPKRWLDRVSSTVRLLQRVQKTMSHLMFCYHRFSPDQRTSDLLPSPWRYFLIFFPVCVERMSWTRRHSNTQGERICVNGVVSDTGYACSFFCVCVAVLLWTNSEVQPQ